MTAQEAIDKMRIQLAEIISSNSRWDDDPHLLFYLNQGRREFSKESEAIKGLFERTTTIGATTGSQYARYQLDPTLWDIDTVMWDDAEVEPMGNGEFDEFVLHREPAALGEPYLYRRFGDSIDLYFAPNSAKTLAIYGSILTTDLPTLASDDTELNDDQIQGAIDHATGMALFDDDRDGGIYLQKFANSTKIYKKKVHRKGPRIVNVYGNYE